MRSVTEEYERRLWEELNSLLVDVVPEDVDVTQDEEERVVMFAIMGHDPDVHRLYEEVKRLERDGGAGYVRAKLEEDNPVARAHRRLYGSGA